MKNQQQQQQSSASITLSLTTANPSNKRPAGNSPQNPNVLLSMNQEASSSSNPSTPAAWASPMDAFKGGREAAGGNMASDDMVFDIYGGGGGGLGYNASCGPITGDYLDFEGHRGMNLL